MMICRVIGSCVATIKDESLQGAKLLIVQEVGLADPVTGRPFIAVDGIGAGVGELVFTATGSSAREHEVTRDTPADAVITGIIDDLEVAGTEPYLRHIDPRPNDEPTGG